MLTITISARAIVLATLLALAALFAFYATDALGSGDNPDSILQGDTDCDGDVDAADALNDLRHVGGLDVKQTEPCPDIGTLAAIPGPQGPQGPPGPQGPQGPQGEQGPPGISDLSFHLEETASNTEASKSLVVPCPEGKTAIAGGHQVVNATDVFIETSAQADAWWVTTEKLNSSSLAPWSLRVQTICAVVEE